MKSREITLQDWSNRSERNQHALFCIAYRLIVHGETLRSAKENVARTAGVNLNTLKRIVKETIWIDFKEPKPAN